MHDALLLRPMTPADHPAVAELIHRSTNHWYRENRGTDIFTCAPEACSLFCEVYEALDPGRHLVIEDTPTGALAGSCFVHPRPTHVALGIMNSDPCYAGQGVARALLSHITALADARGLPTRLVSSAMNLDSYSLYHRAGFRPTGIVQDMLITVPAQGVSLAVLDGTRPSAPALVRPAVPGDVAAIDALERCVAGIRRPDDWRYFIDNAAGHWTCAVSETADGEITGVLASIVHPASAMVGPGVMRDDGSALALLEHTLNQRRGDTLVALIPADRPKLTSALYAWGARNCELHLTQTRGDAPPVGGVVLPTFMPETG